MIMKHRLSDFLRKFGNDHRFLSQTVRTYIYMTDIIFQLKNAQTQIYRQKYVNCVFCLLTALASPTVQTARLHY